MEKEMYAVRVFTNKDGGVSIVQDSYGEESIIALHPSQLPQIIDWLIQASNELNGQ